MLTTQLKSVVAVATAASACVLAASATLGASSGARAASSSHQPASPGSTLTAVPAVPPAVRDHFALFRDQPAAKIPSDVAAAVASPARFGRNPDLAREIATTYGKGWIVPGDGYLCIIVPDPDFGGYGTGCDTVENAVARGLVLTRRQGPDGPGNAVGLVPDGAQAALTRGSLPLRTSGGVVNSPVRADEELDIASKVG